MKDRYIHKFFHWMMYKINNFRIRKSIKNDDLRKQRDDLDDYYNHPVKVTEEYVNLLKKKNQEFFKDIFQGKYLEMIIEFGSPTMLTEELL